MDTVITGMAMADLVIQNVIIIITNLSVITTINHIAIIAVTTMVTTSAMITTNRIITEVVINIMGMIDATAIDLTIIMKVVDIDAATKNVIGAVAMVMDAIEMGAPMILNEHSYP